jgi:uncharacterized membrane protein
MKFKLFKLIAINLSLLMSIAVADPEIVKFTTVTGLLDQWGGAMMFANSDGSVFGGVNYFGGGYTWTEEGGINNIGGMYLRGMNEDGLIIGETTFPMIVADTLTDVAAAAYYDGEEWVMIGPILGAQPFHPGMYQGAWAIAADTMIIAGMHWHDNYHTTAFVWTPEDPDGELLPDNGLTLNSRPNDMSADGSVIVGWASIDEDDHYTDRAAHAWILNELTGEYELVFLGSLVTGYPGYYDGEAFGVSPSGNYICGSSPGAMFIWTEETGMQDIGFMEGHNPLEARALASDITDQGTAVGFAQEQTWVWAREAFIYTPESGLIFLKDSLENLGLEDQFEDWSLAAAHGISDDGLTIVGSCFGLAGIMTPFVLEFIPPRAPTDLASEVYNDADGTWIQLNWTDDPTNNEFSYHLQRRVTIADSTSEWATLAHPDSADNMYTDTEVYFANGIEWEYRLRAENPVGESEWLEIMTASSTDEIALGLPTEFSITGAYPNPFNPSTTINYEIPEQMNTQIVLYSVRGAQLAVLSNKLEEPGLHNLQLDMSSYNSGVYFVRIISGSKMDVQRITLIK